MYTPVTIIHCRHLKYTHKLSNIHSFLTVVVSLFFSAYLSYYLVNLGIKLILMAENSKRRQSTLYLLPKNFRFEKQYQYSPQ